MSTDQDWEKWGSMDPYFGVLSVDEYKQQNLSDEARDDFFRTGEQHVDWILATIRRVFAAEFEPRRTVDFGCGVGRLAVAFARRGSAVVGVDVSTSMLAEARSNCDRQDVRNVDLVLSDDELSAVEGEFDLVHSCLVLQHIPWKRGDKLIDELIKRVRSGGIIAIQFYYHCNAPAVVRGLVRLRYTSRAANALRNLLRGRPLSEPPMQVHVYDLPSILRRLRRAGFADVHQCLGTVANGTFESVTLFARRIDDRER